VVSDEQSRSGRRRFRATPPPEFSPSPSPSPSSSSYLSNPRTFRSMTASTKPTTLLSVDLNGGMAHIAQAPPTPLTPARIPAHLGGPAGSISFSALPPSPSSSYSTSIRLDMHPVQAPQHTTHHPRNNPRPSSPPLITHRCLLSPLLHSGFLGREWVSWGAQMMPHHSPTFPVWREPYRCRRSL